MSGEVACPRCDGFGHLVVVPWVEDENGDYEVEDCPECGGTGVEKTGEAK
jgi:RecJ-like exonuclease